MRARHGRNWIGSHRGRYALQQPLIQSREQSRGSGRGRAVRVFALVIGAFQTLGQLRRAFRLELGESAPPGALLNVMRIMAFGAHEPALLAVARPFTGALAVDAVTPVPVDVAMAFAAQLLRLIEADRPAEIVY